MKKNRENLKQEILDAAKILFLEKGYEKTTLRKIASEVDISATAIYLHYKDKADIMHALHKEGFKLLTAQFETLRHVENPFERLKAMGRVYLNFAINNRDFYEIMFIMKEPLEHLRAKPKEEIKWTEGENAYQSLLTVVEECQKNDYFREYDAKLLSLMVWSNLHGLCALKNNGHLEFISEKIYDKVEVSKVIQSSFNLYVEMLEKL